MSQFNSPQMADSYEPAPQPAGSTPGITIASLIVSCSGICVPLAGLVGIVLGIVGLSASKARNSGRRVAIAGIIVGIVTTPLVCVHIGALLSDFGRQRHSARVIRMIKAESHRFRS